MSKIERKANEKALAVNQPLKNEGLLDRFDDAYKSDIYPRDWSSQQIDTAHHQLTDRRFSSGLYSKVPRICAQTCPFGASDLCKITDRPYGYQCPEEALFMELLIHRYMEELEVDPAGEISALSMIRDLCDIELLLIRKQGILARQELILEEPIMDSRGNPTGFIRYVENPMLSGQEKLWKRKAEIMGKLLATRQDKVKAMGDVAKTNEMAQAAAALKEMRARLAAGEEVDGNYKATYMDEFIDGISTEFSDDKEDE